MDGGLDDMSLLLGELKADLKEAGRQRDALFKKLDKLQEQNTELTGMVKLMAERVGGVEKQIKDDIQPQIENFKELKNRGYGVIAMIGLTSAGVGGFLSTLLGKGGHGG